MKRNYRHHRVMRQQLAGYMHAPAASGDHWHAGNVAGRVLQASGSVGAGPADQETGAHITLVLAANMHCQCQYATTVLLYIARAHCPHDDAR
jgi:hypothetical protein